MKLIARIKSAYNNMKLPVKLLSFVLLASMAPLLLVSLVLDRNMGVLAHDELARSYVQIVRQYADQTQYKLALYKTILSTLSTNSAVIEPLRALARPAGAGDENPYDVALRISRDVGAVMGARGLKDVRNLILYTGADLREVYGPKVSSERLVAGTAWYQAMRTGPNDTYFIQKFPWQNPDTGYYVSFTVPIINPGAIPAKRLGFIKLDVDAGMLFSGGAAESTVFVTGSAGELLYGNARACEEFAAGRLGGGTAGDIQPGTAYDVQLDGHRYMLVSGDIGQYDWHAYFLFNYDELNRRTGEIRSAIFTIALLAMAVIFALTLLISSGITGRIRQLVRKIEKVERGDMQISHVIEGRDEIGILDGHFNHMVSRLQESIRSNYIQELEKREAQLNALQTQINPHFLYNTLETVSAMAAAKSSPEICDIIHKLGAMFRYSIDIGSSEFVPLQSELDHVKSYVSILQARYASKFDVFFNIEPAAASCTVVKFILQPIVENAIAHGFGDLPGAHSIEISAFSRDGLLTVVVQDDGQGMSTEQMENLNRYINERAGDKLDRYKTSIGMRNVNMRIKLAYGDEYGITVTGAGGAGLRVEYRLPAKGRGELG